MSEENTNTATRPSRERKQVERIVVEAISKEKTATEIPEGSGLCLSDYPFFLAGFEKLRTDDDLCKHLHHIMFGALGTKTDRKKSIRKFSGFAAGTDASEKAAKIVDKKGYNNSLLKDTLALFGLERSGTREQMAQRLVEYLQSPSKAKRDGLATPAKNGSKKRKLSKKASKTDKTGPKRAPSAYLLFSQAHRDEVKAANPEASFGELGKLLGARWGEMSEEDKQQWKDKSTAATKALQNIDAGAEDEEDAFNCSDDDAVGEE